MFTMRESQLYFHLQLQNKTNKLCVLCIHRVQTKTPQNGPSVSQLKISSDLSNNCKISPAFKKSCSSKLRKYNMVSNILLLKEATTESSYLLKGISAFWCRTKTKNIPTTVSTFKTSISNLIFIRILFFHTSNSKPKIQIYIYICKQLLCFIFRTRMPSQPLLVEGNDNLRTLHICLLCQHQVSLIRVLPFHEKH